VQQQVRVEAVHVGQPVDRDHPLDQVAAAGQVVGGAPRAGHLQAFHLGDLAGVQVRAVHDQAGAAALAAMGHGDLGRGVPGTAGGAEDLGGGVARQHPLPSTWR
jgi:hypothetical protein